MISDFLNNVAAGSTTATPDFGSATVDLAAGFPAQVIRFFAGLVETLGS